MNIPISQQNQEFLDQAVAAGLFPNQSNALDEAIRLLRERESVRLAVQQGIDQIERGEFVVYGENEVEKFVADIEALARQSFKTK